jgi:hypothetical protein
MIVLWGLPGDNPLRRVAEELRRLNAPFQILDQGNVLETHPVLDVSSDVRGQVQTRGRTLELADVTALYARPYDWIEICHELGLVPSSPEWMQAALAHETLCAWWSVMPGIVLNPPQAMTSNGSKPYQLRLIHAAGLEVPDTLVTTDSQAALDFWERHTTVIYKSVSSVRSKVAQLTGSAVERLVDVAVCPTQFQQYVSGTDVRVHVVGEELFATEIVSGATDYRYDGDGDGGGNTVLRAVTLPPDIHDSCRSVAKTLGLAMAGIDLRRTPGGRWFCLEVNPSPGFTYFESATGQPIAAATARLLAGRSAHSQPRSASHPTPWLDRVEGHSDGMSSPFIRSHERPDVGRAALRAIAGSPTPAQEPQ